jgi:hypothetical protein
VSFIARILSSENGQFGAGPHMRSETVTMMQLCKFISKVNRHYQAKLVHTGKEQHLIGRWVTEQTRMDMLVIRLEDMRPEERPYSNLSGI